MMFQIVILMKQTPERTHILSPSLIGIMATALEDMGLLAALTLTKPEELSDALAGPNKWNMNNLNNPDNPHNLDNPDNSDLLESAPADKEEKKRKRTEKLLNLSC